MARAESVGSGKWRWLCLLAGVLSLGGCGAPHLSSIDVLLTRKPPKLCECIHLYKPYEPGPTFADSSVLGPVLPAVGSGLHMDLDAFMRENKGDTIEELVDKFLDCTVADLAVSTNEQVNEQRRVYRGYVVLALLSRYAAFNYTGLIGSDANLDFRVYPGMHDDALAELARIDTADRLLRTASGIDKVRATAGDDNGEGLTGWYLNVLEQPPKALPTVPKLHRTLAVMLVAVGAEKPTLQRAKGLFGEIVAATATSPLNSGDLLDQGLKIVGKSLTLSTFGNAYLDDARCELESYGRRTGAPSGAKAGAQTGADGQKPCTPDSPAACREQAAQEVCQTCRGHACRTRNLGVGDDDAPTAEDWAYWARIIKDSCQRISAATGVADHCAGWPAEPSQVQNIGG